MPWFKVDDRFWSHPVTSELSDSATALWIRAGSWSACHLTDGEIPKSKLKAFGSRMRAAQELVDAGLWSYSATSETFSIQNWARYQPEKADILRKREDTKNRVNKHRSKDSNAVTYSVSNTAPDPTRTQPIVTKVTNSRATRIDDNWNLDDVLLAWTKNEAPGVNIVREREKFIDYWSSRSGSAATKTDWNRTWKNWIRSNVERNPQLARSVSADPNAWMIAEQIILP
jgi:hypothetical protein